MELGKHLHELSRLRGLLLATFLVALLAAVSVSYRVGLLPPKVEPRNVKMASATAELVVDTPKGTLQDVKLGVSDIEAMTNRAVLIGNVMSSPTVVGYIARRAGLPAGSIIAQAPLTTEFPRPLSTGAIKPRTSDLLRSPDEYRMDIVVNPTVPIIQVYALAPDPTTAARLANASVGGLRDYLAVASQRGGTNPGEGVRISQLGSATGKTIDPGVRTTLSILTFLIVFALMSAAGIFVTRVRRGYQVAAQPPSHEPRPRRPGPAPS